ncbi:MAG: acyltransferase family protein [Clostridia bacterium]|nr:acyltransferase family protein [Clostridia bacterium]
MKQENLEPIGIKERQICFDVLKIIATFAVVMLHVSAQHWFYVKLKTPEWRAFNLYDGSVRFPVPVFVMISGALFLSADRPLRQMYGKYILRIVTAFLFWSVLYAAISYVRGTALIEVLKEAIKGHYHLWYLYMIAGLYVIVPLLRPVVQNRKLLHYFLILSFFVGIVIPQAIVNVFRPNAAEFLQSVWDQAYLYLPFGYSFYFVLGYWLNGIALSKKKLVLAAVLILVGTLTTVFLTKRINYYMLDFNLKHKIVLFYQNQTVNVAMTASGVFLLGRGLFRGPYSARAQKWILALSKATFGVYFVHPIMIDVIKGFGLETVTFNPYLSVPVITILVFLPSLLVSLILNQIPFVRKYLV